MAESAAGCEVLGDADRSRRAHRRFHWCDRGGRRQVGQARVQYQSEERAPCAFSYAPMRRARASISRPTAPISVHIDLPWNPSRLEQRITRIHRKLQPAKQVNCRYFRYAQRETDIVLDALPCERPNVSGDQLGSAGRGSNRGLPDRRAPRRRGRLEAKIRKSLAFEIEEENDAERLDLCLSPRSTDEERARLRCAAATRERPT